MKTQHCRCPHFCIMPPHILRHLAASDNEKLRSIGLRHLELAANLTMRRAAVGLVAATAAAGTKNRNIFDAQHTPYFSVSGPLVFKEGDDEGSITDQDVKRAYDGLGWTYDLYSDEFNRNSIDGNGMTLNAFVHVDNKWDNAQWDGQKMLFGDGDGVVFKSFTVSIDIIGHELTHGVTQHSANLAYHDQPGALNESFSDVFGSLVKQYSLKQDVNDADWLIGAGIFKPGINGKALRSMADPGSAYNDPKIGKDPQPKDMADYVQTSDDFGGVHINSGIPNHAFYLLAMALGGNSWGDAGHIWYDTLRGLSPHSQFQDCADISYKMAAPYGSAAQKAVVEAWYGVGIKVNLGTGTATAKKAKSAAVAAAGNGDLAKELEKLEHGISRVRELVEAH
jgi:Zn-dependent metalloprotease